MRSRVRAPVTHILLHIIILTYRSLYGRARVAQISRPICLSGAVGPDCHTVGGILEPDKMATSPLLYHLGYIVELAEGSSISST
jgi:hypothetical protein